MESQKQKSIITLGNGQLGLMLQKAATRLGVKLETLAIADAWDWLKIANAENVLITFEQEHVDEALLDAVVKSGIPSFPSMESFLLLRSKLQQKEFLQKHGVPTSPFLAIPGWTPEAVQFVRQSGGAVLKAGKGGYDGKGVWILDSDGNNKAGPASVLLQNIDSPYLEKKIPFDYEVAAVVCRSHTGAVELYPTVKSQQKEGICYQVEYTEQFANSDIAKKAGEIARNIANQLQYVGVLAIELFVQGNEVLVNEIAPRVHNSGHFTIDVCAGSQFENHLRAGLGMPLAKTAPTHPAALMVNLLWPAHETEFAPLFTKLTCGPEWPKNVTLHWYGKTSARPNRKMGHFTVYGNDIAECHRLAQQVLASRWS